MRDVLTVIRLLWDISILKGVIFLHVKTLIRLQECSLIMIQLEYLLFCSYKIDVFFSDVCCKDLRFSYLYALVYGDINLFCLMFAYFILLCN